jgi:PAS domain S-box-containing protein
MPSPAPPLVQLPRTRVTAVNVALLVVVSTTIWIVISILVFSQQEGNGLRGLFWHIVLDGVFGLTIAALAYWLVRQGLTLLATTEEALHNSEERLRRITDNSLDLICEIDAQRVFRYASPSYRTVLGYEPEQLMGQSFLAFVHPDDIGLVIAAEQATTAPQRIESRLELRVRHATSHFVWLESMIRFTRDEHAAIQGAVLISRDVTQRKQTAEALTRHARSMAALYETSLEINSQPDTATLLNAIVRRACNLLDTNMGGLYLVNEQDGSIVLVASQPPEVVGTVLRQGEGSAGHVALTGQPLVISDYSMWPQRAAIYEGPPIARVLSVPMKLHDRIIGILSIDGDQPGDFSDDDIRLASLFADQAVLAIQNRQLLEQARAEVLQRRQAEQALRESEGRYRLLIENQGEGICFVDEQESLTFANPAANEIFGLGSGTLVGHNLKEFMSTEDFEIIRRETKIRQTGQTSTYETRIHRADGQLRTLLVTARPRFAVDGTFLGTFSIFRDITTREQAEKELARTQAIAERRNQQLTQILEAGNALRAMLDLDEVLREIVYSAHRSLDFGIVVLNILDPVSNKSRVHSFAGLDEPGRQVLENAEYEREQELQLMRPEFAVGRAYFIPAGTLQWEQDFNGPMYVPDMPRQSVPEAWDPDDVLFIPIELRSGEIVGTIWLDMPRDGQRPTIDSLRPLEIFVNQAVIAIENARLFEAERQRRRELETVYAASRRLTQSLDLTQVLDTILNGVMQLVPAASTQLFLYDGEQLEFGAGLAMSGQKLAQPPIEPRHNGLTYTVARAGEGLFIEDTASHPVFNASFSFQPPLLAVAALPLKIETTTLGVMNVSYSKPHRFDESERRTLEMFAAQAAIAIQNARLHDQVRQYASELEQRVAERTTELDHERQHLQAILDSAGEGIQIMDPEGRIEYVNPTTEDLTGFAAQEIVGQVSRLWDISAGASHSLEQARRQLQQGRAWRGEIINRRKDGGQYDLAVTVTPLKDVQNQITGYVAVHRDITHLKALERLKDQFVSRIGHELRTPLAIIKLHVELLDRGKPEKFNDYVQTLHTQIDRLRRLIDGFLEISQFDAGQVTVHRTSVNINQIARELLLDRRAQFAARHLTLIEELEARLDQRPLKTDRALAAKAIGHLLDNALHYAPHDGSITFNTGMQSYADLDWVTVTVHNDGPGISPEEQPHLFERFYRGEAARDYKVPGAGLGLSLSEAIAKLLDGRLTVDSVPGQGITFTLWLKAAISPDQPRTTIFHGES